MGGNTRSARKFARLYGGRASPSMRPLASPDAAWRCRSRRVKRRWKPVKAPPRRTPS